MKSKVFVMSPPHLNIKIILLSAGLSYASASSCPSAGNGAFDGLSTALAPLRQRRNRPHIYVFYTAAIILRFTWLPNAKLPVISSKELATYQQFVEHARGVFLFSSFNMTTPFWHESNNSPNRHFRKGKQV